MMAVMHCPVTALCQRCACCRAWSPVDELVDVSETGEPLLMCAKCAREYAEEQREEYAQDIEF